MADIEDFEERRVQRELLRHIAEVRERAAEIEAEAPLWCVLLEGLIELREAMPTLTDQEARELRGCPSSHH
jgi:hypothetical protein